MSVTYASLKLKINNEVKKFTFNDKEIEVKQYLPATDKIDILEMVIQEADSGTVVNTFAIDCLFHLYIVYEYTNITFTEKQKEDPYALYDALESTGLIDQVVLNMKVEEYNELKTALDDILNKYAVYRNSVRGSLEQLQAFVPQQAGEMAEALQNMDFDKMSNVLSLADEAGIRFEKK